MITIKQGDITNEDVEAIVNAANSGLRGGGGVDGAIHMAAGPSVMQECLSIGGCKTGSAVITGAGDLRARNIIHAVGPVWHGGRLKEAGLLKSAYVNSFLLAREHGLRSIAFPAISTGAYGYPIEEAAKVALTVGKVYEKYFDEIRYVCYSKQDLDVYQRVREELNKPDK